MTRTTKPCARCGTRRRRRRSAAGTAKHVLALEEELATHIMEDDEMDEF